MPTAPRTTTRHGERRGDPELEVARRIATDPTVPTADRALALLDLLDARVGNTPLVRAPALEDATGIGQLLLKLEGHNPGDSHTGRVAGAMAIDALRHGFDTLAAAAEDAYGAALCSVADWCGLRVVLHVPAEADAAWHREVTARGGALLRVGGGIDNAAAQARQWAQRPGVYDATLDGTRVDLQLDACARIAEELCTTLGDAPAIIAGPLTTRGLLLAGIHRGFRSLRRRGRIGRLPRIVVGRAGGAPATDAVPRRLATALDESGGCLRELSPHALGEAVRALRDTGAEAVSALGAAGLAAVVDLHRENPCGTDRHVIVLGDRVA
ncbi:MAG: pyridoxal-phosphate dependent enzyme [Planctomycetes bacterium]|nr:pyridoxal-phosphate dependent enzyme [Planctomycetota bacterium]